MTLPWTIRPQDDDGEPLDVAGPFCVPIDAARHYEWDRETGWRVVRNDE